MDACQNFVFKFIFSWSSSIFLTYVGNKNADNWDHFVTEEGTRGNEHMLEKKNFREHT